ncbi:hypothetical protein A0H81_14672 [Grifola frondosa]|uniref:Uncharacterized protein n=1 Tax=Grifola frondosa TaxID=5627 RepID=A0A1C7LN33_GRIFR|nr:hypothetical protein A0H81_14672 [Grifola frondosa]
MVDELMRGQIIADKAITKLANIEPRRKAEIEHLTMENDMLKAVVENLRITVLDSSSRPHAEASTQVQQAGIQADGILRVDKSTSPLRSPELGPSDKDIVVKDGSGLEAKSAGFEQGHVSYTRGFMFRPMLHFHSGF